MKSTTVTIKQNTFTDSLRITEAMRSSIKMFTAVMTITLLLILTSALLKSEQSSVGRVRVGRMSFVTEKSESIQQSSVRIGRVLVPESLLNTR
jgi:hypothetical protein